jgi:hypothetical protein
LVGVDPLADVSCFAFDVEGDVLESYNFVLLKYFVLISEDNFDFNKLLVLSRRPVYLSLFPNCHIDHHCELLNIPPPSMMRRGFLL